MPVGIIGAAWSGVYEPQLVLTTSSSTPEIKFNFVTMPMAGDIIKVYDGAGLLGSYTLTQTNINNGSFALGLTTLASGTHSLKVFHVQGSKQSAYSNSINVTV